MRLITLNVWGGRVEKKLIPFLGRHASTTDIFFFQEVYHNNAGYRYGRSKSRPRLDVLNAISDALGPNFTAFYSPADIGFDDLGPVGHHLEFGNATFIRRALKLVGQEEIYVYKSRAERASQADTEPRSIQVSQIQLENERLAVINFHGLWQHGTNKQDNPDRLEQSRKLREVTGRLGNRVVLAGDFNLLPDTESIAILEQGMRNLIKERNILSTRSSLYPADKPSRLADYILVSPDIVVRDFRVLPIEVSDHLPLMLDFA